MLYLYPSNKTETLAELMAGLMDKYPLRDPFQSEIILTQSYGMGVWLQQQISEQIGISALIETKMPGAFVWDLIEKLVPQEGGGETRSYVQFFEKETLRWEIYRRLPELLKRDSFSGLRGYVDALTHSLGDQNIAGDERSALFEVSELLADLFDAYQNYRSDWIETWEAGRSILSSSQVNNIAIDEAWQRELWVALYPDQPLENRGHRSSQVQSLIDVLDSTDSNLSQALPERLFLFGMGAVPSQWIALFVLIARHTDVHFLLQNPSQYYWGDIANASADLSQQANKIRRGQLSAFSDVRDVEGNRLLASWGELGKAFISELYRFDQSDGMQELEHSLYEESQNHSALACIQNDILALRQEVQPVEIDDGSFRFSRCHNRTREVEALRDYLLNLLESSPEISARDIIVMAPDIQQYSASIESVFGVPTETATGKTFRLPFGISDQSAMHDQPLLESAAQLLSLDASRVSLPEVIELLSVPAIAQRAGLLEEDIEALTELCLRLNIRWGLNEAHRDRLSGAKKSGEQNTWLEGFRRCFTSYVLGDLDSTQKELFDLEPFALHGRALHEAVGKLARFLALIESTCALQQEEHALEDWIARCYRLFQDWFDLDSVDESTRLLITKTLDTLQTQASITGLEESLPFSIIAGCIKSSLDNEKVSQRFLAGRINFCNLMPMRSIPFKVVCLLGMNDGEYPRLDTRQSFDLMARLPPRRGDRSRRIDDRYMFLESLLSAREYFYVSYQGFDAKDNSEQPPSILVSELQEYCRSYLAGINGETGEQLLDAWTISHRLQPFHPCYFVENSSQCSTPLTSTFDRNWLALFGFEQGNNNDKSGATISNHESDERISKDRALDDVVRLFSNPLAYYYQSVLGIHLGSMPDTLPDTEPFLMRGLEGYSVAQVLNQDWWLNNDSSISYDVLRRQGALPREPYASLELERIAAEQAGFRSELEALKDTTLIRFSKLMPAVSSIESIHGEFFIGNFGQIEVRQSKSVEKVFFGLWFKHVLWNVLRSELVYESASGVTTLVTPTTKLTLPELDAGLSNRYLEELLQYFDDTLQRPKLFAPVQAYGLLLKPEASANALFEVAIADTGFASLWERATSLRQRDCITEVPNPHEDAVFRQAFNHVLESKEADAEGGAKIEWEKLK